MEACCVPETSMAATGEQYMYVQKQGSISEATITDKTAAARTVSEGQAQRHDRQSILAPTGPSRRRSRLLLRSQRGLCWELLISMLKRKETFRHNPLVLSSCRCLLTDTSPSSLVTYIYFYLLLHPVSVSVCLSPSTKQPTFTVPVSHSHAPAPCTRARQTIIANTPA